MRAVFVATLLAACVAASLHTKTSLVADMMMNSTPSPMAGDQPVEQWHYNYFGGDFEPLVLQSVNLVFVPVNFQAEGSAIYVINLDNGLTNYTMRLNYDSTGKMWGPGPHSFDPKTNRLYLTNRTSFICIDAPTGNMIWVTEAPMGITSLGLGEVAVAGNGYVYYSGLGYQKNGVSQVTILNAATGDIVASQNLWEGSAFAMCQDDTANDMGPRPLYNNANDTIASRLLFACGGCALAVGDITNPTNLTQAWISPLDNCNATQVPRGGYTISNQFDELVYQWNGNNLTALNAMNGKVQWNYKLPEGVIINAPAVDTSGNVFVAHVNAMGTLQLQRLGSTRQDIAWTWNYTSVNATVVDYHVVYDFISNQLYVSLTTSTPGSASKGTSFMCGVDARSGDRSWCTTVVNPARGTPKSSRIALDGPYVVVASAVSEEGTPYSAGTVTAYKHQQGSTPAPEGGIILKNCSGSSSCGGSNCRTQYPNQGCNAGSAPGSSVLYFCAGGNTLLYAQYFTNSTTCTGIPSSAEEYGLNVCHPVDSNMDSILVTHC